MQNRQAKMVRYFGYGTNRDHDMMAAMIGRNNLLGVPGKLPGYELCIQALSDIPDVVAERAPVSLSPREIVGRAFGSSFEVYVTRPNPGSVAYGTIWDITSEELKLVHEWELLDFGMQNEMKATAVGSDGEAVDVDTHGLQNPDTPVNRVVSGDDYVDYLVPREDILRVANEVRLEYLARISAIDSAREECKSE